MKVSKRDVRVFHAAEPLLHTGQAVLLGNSYTLSTIVPGADHRLSSYLYHLVYLSSPAPIFPGNLYFAKCS